MPDSEKFCIGMLSTYIFIIAVLAEWKHVVPKIFGIYQYCQVQGFKWSNPNFGESSVSHFPGLKMVKLPKGEI